MSLTPDRLSVFVCLIALIWLAVILFTPVQPVPYVSVPGC